MVGNPEVSILDRADHADGEEDDGADELEDSADRYADDAEGNQEYPDDGVSNERNQSQRPAENEKNAEEQEFGHRECLASNRKDYAAVRETVPSRAGFRNAVPGKWAERPEPCTRMLWTLTTER
jgi:hypothetical protein